MNGRWALGLAAGVALAGCRAKEITPLDRAEAANEISEAQFAVTIQDWGRAESLFAKAGETCPDDGNTWLNLGIVRMRMKNPGGARDAYKSAVKAYRAAFQADPSDSGVVLREAYVLAILGRPDDARSLVVDTQAKYPDDRRLRAFVDSKSVERMLGDPAIKDVSP